MEDSAPKPGRPVHVAEYVEGKEAAENFKKALKTIMSVPKQEVLDAEAEKTQKAWRASRS